MSSPALYGSLVPWYRLFTPPEHYAEEAGCYRDALLGALGPGPHDLLELGAGAGHNAFHLKHDFACTLTDLSQPMLDESLKLNPDCIHVAGDMRTLRLGRTFDAVFVHDAIMYMLSEAELRQAMETAFVHLRPGGAAIFAPDHFRETFAESVENDSSVEGTRAVHSILYSWDPDLADTTVLTEYVFLLREGSAVRTVHDTHVEGLFARGTWEALLGEVGFRTERVARPIGDGVFDEIFLCRR
jgi:SAM-dependent methyltransferase